MDPKLTIEKLQKGEPLTEKDTLALLTKASNPTEGPTLIPENANRIYDEIQRMYKQDFKASAKAAMHLISSLSGYANACDKEFPLNNLPKILETLDVILTPNGQNDNSWDTVSTLLFVPVAQHMPGKTKFYAVGIPVVLKGLTHKKVQGSAHGVFSQIALNAPRQLVSYVDSLVPAMKAYPMISGSMVDVFKQKPELWVKHIPTLIEFFADYDDRSRSMLLSLLNAVSEQYPKELKPICQNPDFKECLFSKMTSAMAGMVLKNIVVSSPTEFVDWTDDLMDALKANDMLAFIILAIFGIIGLIDENQAKRMTNTIFDWIKAHMNIQSVGQALLALKNIQSKYPTTVVEHIPVLKQLIESSPFPEVKDLSKGIIATSEARDLDSLHSQVQTNTAGKNVRMPFLFQDIKTVQNKVEQQDQKIEAVEKTTAETQKRMDVVEVQVQETREEVKQVVDRVDKVETKVEEQQVQIKQILDRFDEMNAKVQESCKSYDELKAYVDKNVDMLKEFIAEVSKKLPQPYNFTANGKVIRTMTLWFDCSLHEEGCLYTRDHPFKTDTQEWAKWLKVGFSLMKLGKALYDKSLLDAYGACKEIYDTMQSKEDANFVAYISQPFLTSSEQDSLIEQLRDQRFFDLFSYHAYSASWACVKCAKRDKDRREGKIPETSQQLASPSNENSSVASSSSPSSNNAGAAVTGTLKLKRGLLGRIHTLRVVFESGQMKFFEQKKKTDKPVKIILKTNIVNFVEVDARVAKKENAFNLITVKRTYEMEALSKEDYLMWKNTLSP